MRRAVRMMRQAISPRLAIRRDANIAALISSDVEEGNYAAK
jgi:hypothetical protein